MRNVVTGNDSSATSGGGTGMPRKFETAGQGSVWSLASVRLRGQALIARGGADGVVRFIDVTDGTEVMQIDAHQGPVRALLAVPDPTPVAGGDGPSRITSGGLDGYVRLWDLRDPQGHRQARFHDEVWSLACLDIEGRTLFAGTGAGGVVEVWEPYGAGATRTLAGAAGRVWALAPIEVDGRPLLAVGGADGSVRLLDPITGQAIRAIRAHRSTVWTLTTVQVDGRELLASGGADALICLWDPTTGEQVRQFSGHLSTIRAMTVVDTAAGYRLASGSADSTIRVWNPQSTMDTPEHVFSDNSGEIWALAPVIDGQGLLAGGGAEGTVFLYNPMTRQTSSLLAGSSNTVWALTAVDPGGQPMLASGGVEGPISLIDMETRTVERVLRGHRSTVRTLATVDGPGPEMVASAGADAWVRLWDVRSGAETKKLHRSHIGEVWSLVSFHHDDGRYVASGGADGKVRVWPAHGDGLDPVIIGDHGGEIFAMTSVPLPDGPVVASGGAGGVHLWDGLRGGHRVHFGSDSGTAWALTTYPFGTGWRVACALANGTVATFDPVTGAHTGDLASAAVQVRALVTATVDNRVLVIGGCQDGAIQIWDAASGSLLARLTAHTGTVRALAVAHLDKRPQLASASDDGDVRQHDLSDLSDEGKIRVSARPTTQIASDRPSLVDTVGRGAVVDALHDFLTDPGTTPPVVIGVHGPWGHGKSSVLAQLRGRLDPPSQQPESGPTHALEWRRRSADGGEHWTRAHQRLSLRWAQRRLAAHAEEITRKLPARLVPLHPTSGRQITVWFSPWMYHSRDELWAGLSQEIIKAVTGRLPEDDQRRLWFELNLRRSDPVAIRRRLLLSFLPRTPLGLLTALIALAVIALGLLTEGTLIVGDRRLAALFVGLPAVGLLIKLFWSMLRGSVAGVLPPSVLTGPSTGGLNGAGTGSPGTDLTDPLHESRAGYLYLVQHDIGQIVGLATADTPVVVFIDDLDRCSSDMIADTIEAINLFVNNAFGQCNFVIALDPATIAAHVEASHDGLMRRIAAAPLAYAGLGDVGWRFMEKIIDLPIRLPRLSAEAVAAYTHTLLAPPRQPAGSADLVGSPVVPDPPDGSAGGRVRPAGRRRTEPRTIANPSAPANPATPANPSAPANPLAVAVAAPARIPAPRPPEEAGAAEAARAVAAVESIPEVSELVRLAALALPRRSPRETKRFLNLWRFYLSIEYRQGRLVGDRAELAVTARTIAQFVEVLLRWPKYLDRLGEQSGGRPLLASLTGLAADQDQWPDELRRAGLDPDDANLEALRKLLVLTDEAHFPAIAERYL
jgi:WD40 repeat protein